MPVAAAALLAVAAAYVMIACKPAAQNAGDRYEVMSPWGEADPIPLRGISPRINTLEGKKIGVFANSKRSAIPQARMTEKKLKGRFPTIQTEFYHSPEFNVMVVNTPNKEKFLDWINSIDAAVLMVGD